MGFQKLRSWFARPSTDINLIRERHDCVQLFYSNSTVAESIRKSLRYVRNIPRILAEVKSGGSNLRTWNDLSMFLTQIKVIGNHLSGLDNFHLLHSTELFQDQSYIQEIDEISASIMSIIDLTCQMLKVG